MTQASTSDLVPELLNHFEAIFELSPQAAACISPTGRLVGANASFLGSFGEVGERTQQIVTAMYESVQASTGANARTEVVTRHGRRIVGDVTVFAVHNAGAMTIGRVLVVKDVSDQARLEAGLRANEERLNLTTGAVKDYAIVSLDWHGHITNWSAGAERTHIYTAREILGKHFSVFYTTEDRQRGHPEYALRVAKREGRFEGEGWRLRKDGSHLWMSVVILAVRDKDGMLHGFLAITRDITGQRHRERPLIAAKRAAVAG